MNLTLRGWRFLILNTNLKTFCFFFLLATQFPSLQAYFHLIVDCLHRSDGNLNWFCLVFMVTRCCFDSLYGGRRKSGCLTTGLTKLLQHFLWLQCHRPKKKNIVSKTSFDTVLIYGEQMYCMPSRSREVALSRT